MPRMCLNTLAIDEPLEYARLYLEGNMQMCIDAEDSLDTIIYNFTDMLAKVKEISPTYR